MVGSGWNYRRQRRDQLADQKRTSQRERLTPLLKIVERLEPLLRAAKQRIDKAEREMGGLLFLRNRHLSREEDRVDWSLDRDHEDIVTLLEFASDWLHEHAPELVDLRLPATLQTQLDDERHSLEDAHTRGREDDYRESQVRLFGIVAPLREDLRTR